MNSEINTILGSANPLGFMLVMGILATVPLLLMSVTSFLKLSIVFNILRTALGAGQLPSGAVTTVLAIVMTANIMSGVITEVGAGLNRGLVEPAAKSEPITEKLGRLYSAVSEPLQKFLLQHAGAKERKFFAERNGSHNVSSSESNQCDKSACLLPGENMASLIGAFVLSELRSGFLMGFILFLPFLVIDIIVANLLVGMGMNMVNPTTIAVPIKILIFVVFDAWFAICQALVKSYMVG